MNPWLIVSGDFAQTGGQDRAVYCAGGVRRPARR